jgi:hypothetical protein
VSDLDKWISEADKNSPFLKFEDGEPVEGVFRGAKIIDDPFKVGEQTMEYTLDVDGVKKTFKSKSTKLARLFHKFAVGDEVQVVKTGESFKTLWYVDSPDKKK